MYVLMFCQWSLSVLDSYVERLFRLKTKLHVLNFGWHKDNRELPHYLVSVYMCLNVSRHSD